ncbi:MAG: hypothetical protein ACI9K2_005075, partial [Myxococcota bacterium]
LQRPVLLLEGSPHRGSATPEYFLPICAKSIDTFRQ